jgi:hypothetical protein
MTQRTMRVVLFGPILAALLTSPAYAEVEPVSSSGDIYTVSENVNGFVLTSKYPKSHFIEQGASSYFVEGPDVFYFGRSCDAFHKLFGNGTWSWANAGYGAQFEGGFSLWFPRQDVPWESGLSCMAR